MGVVSLWFYAFAIFVDSVVVSRVSTMVLLISYFWWYHDRDHKISKLFDRFIVVFSIGFIFFTLAQMSVLNTYWPAFLTWSASTLILLLSIFPNTNFKKVNAMIYALGAVLLVFNIYLMYSSMLILAPQFDGFEVFSLVLLGIIQVIFITIGALYFLLSGSDKSRLLMICAVTHSFSLLLGAITYFYQDNTFLNILTRVLFVAFLFSFYYYITYVEVPKYELDLDLDDDGRSAV